MPAVIFFVWPPAAAHGGVILAKGHNRTGIERIVLSDPLHREQIAQYSIVEFLPSMAATEFASFKAP